MTKTAFHAAGVCLAFLVGIQTPAIGATNETATAADAIGQFLSENGWGLQDGIEAARTLRRLYLRETKTEEGRRRWHGKRTSVVTDAATGRTISTYEDGEVFTDEKKSGATVQTTAVPSYSSLPESVKAARREAWLAKRQTNVVTQVITIGGGAQ